MVLAARDCEVSQAAALVVALALFVAPVRLGASSIDFTVLVWAKSSDWVAVQGAVRHACYDALNEAGIDIPFDQVVVHQAEAAS